MGLVLFMVNTFILMVIQNKLSDMYDIVLDF